MLKSERDFIAISDSGSVRQSMKSEENTYNFGFDENIRIEFKDNGYVVEQWECDKMMKWMQWVYREKFETEHEAMMYGLTLI